MFLNKEHKTLDGKNKLIEYTNFIKKEGCKAGVVEQYAPAPSVKGWARDPSHSFNRLQLKQVGVGGEGWEHLNNFYAGTSFPASTTSYPNPKGEEERVCKQ